MWTAIFGNFELGGVVPVRNLIDWRQDECLNDSQVVDCEQEIY